MKVDSVVRAVARRIFLLQLTRLTLRVFVVAVIFALLGISFGIGKSLAVLIGLSATIALLSAAFLTKRFPRLDLEKAALLIDKTYGLKERITTAAENTSIAATQLIEEQLRLKLSTISSAETVPFQLSKNEWGFIIAIVLGILSLFFYPTTPPMLNNYATEISILKEIVEKENEISPQLKNALIELGETLEDNTTTEQETKDALEEAKIELQREEQRALLLPTPTPTEATQEQSKKEEQKEKENQEQQQNKEENQDKKEPEKNEKEKKEQDSKGDEKGESKDQEKGEQGKEEQKQSGEEQSKQNGEAKEQEGKGKEEKGEGSGQGEGEGQGQGKGEQEGDQKQQGQQGGKSEGQQASQQAVAAALDKIEQKMDQSKEQKQKEGAKGSGQGQGDQQGKNKQGENKQGENKQGENKGDQKTEGKEQQQEDKKSDGDGKGEGKKEEQGDKQEQGEGKDQSAPEKQEKSDKEAGNKGAGAPKDDENAKRYLEEGDKGNEISDKAGFKESTIKEDKDKVDTQFVGQDKQVVKNTKEAESKVPLSEVIRDKPDKVTQQELQQIPLEYRDVLK